MIVSFLFYIKIKLFNYNKIIMKENIRKEIFPFFKNNPNITYLDSSLTTIKPKVVINEISNFYQNFLPTIERSNNLLTEKSKELFLISLLKIAHFINSRTINEIIPVAGTTNGLNLLALALTDDLKAGDELILGEFEHASNYIPWLVIAKKKKLKIRHYKIKENFEFDYDHLKTLLNNKTKIIAISHIFNSIGILNDLKKIKKIIGDNILLVADAAQSVGHIKIDVRDLNCDFLVFGGHKMFGPNGIGIIYGKEKLLKKLNLFNYGGGMFQYYDLNKFDYRKLPNKFYAGTPNISGIIGLAKAIDFINSIGIEKIRSHNEKLKFLLEEKLEKINDIIILNKNIKSSILLFKKKNIHSEDINYELQQNNIFVRSGFYCVNYDNKLLNTKEQSIRVSFHYYNNENDLKKLVDVIKNGGDFLNGLFNSNKNKKCA
ncbi:putative cysteine desulfurase [Candidatus Hepatoplasma crinochetorum Av]|uniref:Putative cysteine desulfurase n=2 Tax=Candidatus Hepatoplasma crinochetorum TaxID=295596 RepID=W8GEP7_9MOLU|nr:putative cysteine desulfurase [Candidatus Hepatoplasma crinochetorum Av]BDV02855.1 MAG: aminotransferase [Candidatus Hepatoplasma crinochetorum]